MVRAAVEAHTAARPRGTADSSGTDIRGLVRSRAPRSVATRLMSALNARRACPSAAARARRTARGIPGGRSKSGTSPEFLAELDTTLDLADLVRVLIHGRRRVGPSCRRRLSRSLTSESRMLRLCFIRQPGLRELSRAKQPLEDNLRVSSIGSGLVRGTFSSSASAARIHEIELV